jgi:conjugal transfer ATP-binding protein TraC
MLSQKPESIDQLKKNDRISMSAQKEAQLKSVRTKQGQYAELMIITPEGYAVCRFMVDPTSNLLYSTKAEDYAAVKQLTDEGVHIIDAVDQLINTRELLTATH